MARATTLPGQNHLDLARRLLLRGEQRAEVLAWSLQAPEHACSYLGLVLLGSEGNVKGRQRSVLAAVHRVLLFLQHLGSQLPLCAKST